MNKKTKYLLYATILPIAAIYASCSDENPWGKDTGQGFISPRLQASAEVKGYSSTRSGDIEVPEASQFALKLEKSDGSYAKSWTSFTNFDTNATFKIGTYTMAASYGDIDDEGIGRPYFYGAAQFEIKENQTTDVSITASLANSMVSLIYTDAFKTYFSDWNGTLHSEGGAYITLPKEETRPIYVKPGNVSILLAITKQNGNAATFQPADFKALPRHHYRITFDVNGGEVGEGKLVITFDETIEKEEVEIDLSDEIFTAPAPEVIAKGFEPGTPLKMLEYTSGTDPLQFFIKAKSGVKEAKLTLNSSATLPLGKEFDICTLSDMQLHQLAEAGIKETGLSRNPGTMAQLDMTSLISSLPAGTHSFTLVVKDKLTKVNDPVTLTVTALPITIEIAKINPLAIGDTQAGMTINFNGSDLATGLSIEAIDDFGAWKECGIVRINPKTSARRTDDAFPLKQYEVEFALPSSTRDIDYRLKYAGKTAASGTITRGYPEYSVSIDPYSRKAVIYVHPQNESDKASVVKNIRVFAGSNELVITQRNESKGYVIASGLQPSATYELKTTLRTGASPAFNETVTITTEGAQGVPNGDFETLVEKINVSSMTQGGAYTRTLIGSSAHNTQSLIVSEPQHWATTNAKTFNTSATNQNSWFVTPSVFNTSLYFQSKTHFFSSGFGGDTSTPQAYTWNPAQGNNAMVIRNVAYDPAGTDPAVEKKTATPTGYYNSKTPTINYKAVGKLFLGTYSYSNGSETYSEGVAFASRPASLSGQYRFTEGANATGEKGLVKIELLNGSDVIGTGQASLAPNADYGTFNVAITYNVAHTKATSLRIMLASSEKTGTIAYETANISTTPYASLFEQEARGSVLVVDNLTFNY